MVRCLPDGGRVDEADLADLLDSLASTLRATEELPVPPSASIRLGEAHAIAADLASGDVDPSVVHERTGHVRRLLTDVDTADNEAVADHVADALRLIETIRAATEPVEES